MANIDIDIEHDGKLSIMSSPVDGIRDTYSFDKEEIKKLKRCLEI